MMTNDRREVADPGDDAGGGDGLLTRELYPPLCLTQLSVVRPAIRQARIVPVDRTRSQPGWWRDSLLISGIRRSTHRSRSNIGPFPKHPLPKRG